MNNYNNRRPDNYRQAGRAPQRAPQGGRRQPPKKRKPRYNYTALFVLGATALVIIIIFIVIVKSIVGAFVGTSGETESGKGSPETSGESSTEAETTAETEAPAPSYAYIDKTAADIHTGDIVLINYDHKFVEPQDFKLINLYGNKNKSYKLSGSQMNVTDEMLTALNAMLADFDAATGKHDVIITSAYRSEEEQQEIMDMRIKEYGEELAKVFVAEPGYSEHHSGLAVDIAVYTDAGEGMGIDDDPIYDWIAANCAKYGIIQRYMESKSETTKIANEPWHFRYIGKTHAGIITKLGMCLEEYHEHIRAYSIDNRLSVEDGEGGLWELYFVPQTGDVTSIPYPIGTEPYISGNNYDGFVVAIPLA